MTDVFDDEQAALDALLEQQSTEFNRSLKKASKRKAMPKPAAEKKPDVVNPFLLLCLVAEEPPSPSELRLLESIPDRRAVKELQHKSEFENFNRTNNETDEQTHRETTSQERKRIENKSRHDSFVRTNRIRRAEKKK